MEITDVQIRLVRRPTDRLRAFCNVTFDDEFVIRDMKIVDGANGLFVAMPSRKVNAGEGDVDNEGRQRQYRDIAHPITTAFREKLQERVLDAYEDEMAAAKAHGSYEYSDESDEEFEGATPKAPARGNGGRGSAPRRSTGSGGGGSKGDRQPTEYDELIAGLRGRPAGGEGRRDHGGRPTGESRGRDGGSRGERGGKDQRGRGTGNRRGQSSEEGHRGERREAPSRRPRRDEQAAPATGRRSSNPPPPAPEPIDLTEPDHGVETEAEIEGFGAGILGDASEPSQQASKGTSGRGQSPKRTPKPAGRSSESQTPPPPPADEVRIEDTAEVEETDDAREDTQAFGAGIL